MTHQAHCHLLGLCQNPSLIESLLLFLRGGKLDKMQDRKSWSIKDEAILDDLIALINLSDEEKESLKSLKEQAESVAPSLSKAFYGRLQDYELTAEYVEGQIELRRKILQTWFVQLFEGTYDEVYVKSRLRIGYTHVQIGLPVRYALATMDLVLEAGYQVAVQSDNPELAKRAFRKIFSIDTAIFNQAYEDAQLKHLAEMLGNERLARRILTR